MEKAVRFTNEKGHTLHGILHLPDEGVATRGTGLVWLSAGQKVRQGAWRMNVAVARRLAAAGIPTLRFDYRGIGDSEGEARHGEMVMDLYGFIQSGGFRGDAVAAGDKLILLESMKMVIPIVAPRAGRVARVLCAVGESVPAGLPLVEMEE